MSSVAYNLKRKLEWMKRRIRYIDYAGELKDWVDAMMVINSLLMEVNIKEFTCKWKPWSNREDGVNMDFGRWIPECTEVLKPPKKRKYMGINKNISLKFKVSKMPVVATLRFKNLKYFVCIIFQCQPPALQTKIQI